MATGKFETTAKRIVAVTAVFQRGKTQIPAEVRASLGLRDGSKLVWSFKEGNFIVESAENP